MDEGVKRGDRHLHFLISSVIMATKKYVPLHKLLLQRKGVRGRSCTVSDDDGQVFQTCTRAWTPALSRVRDRF